MLIAHLKEVKSLNFITSDYSRYTYKNLTIYKISNQTATKYIDKFRFHLVCCTDVSAAQAKLISETKMAD